MLSAVFETPAAIGHLRHCCIRQSRGKQLCRCLVDVLRIGTIGFQCFIIGLGIGFASVILSLRRQIFHVFRQLIAAADLAGCIAIGSALGSAAADSRKKSPGTACRLHGGRRVAADQIQIHGISSADKATGIACCGHDVPASLTGGLSSTGLGTFCAVLRVFPVLRVAAHIGEAKLRLPADLPDEAAGIAAARHIDGGCAVADFRFCTAAQAADETAGIAAAHAAVFTQAAAFIHIKLHRRAVRSAGFHRTDEAADITRRGQLAILCLNALQDQLVRISHHTDEGSRCGTRCIAEAAVQKPQIPDADRLGIPLTGNAGKNALSPVFRIKIHHGIAPAVIGQKGIVLNGTIAAAYIAVQVIYRDAALRSRRTVCRNFRCEGLRRVDRIRCLHCLSVIIRHRRGFCINKISGLHRSLYTMFNTGICGQPGNRRIQILQMPHVGDHRCGKQFCAAFLQAAHAAAVKGPGVAYRLCLHSGKERIGADGVALHLQRIAVGAAAFGIDFNVFSRCQRRKKRREMRILLRHGIQTQQILPVLSRVRRHPCHVQAAAGLPLCSCRKGGFRQCCADNIGQIPQRRRKHSAAFPSLHVKHRIHPGVCLRHPNVQEKPGTVFNGQHRCRETSLRHSPAAAAVIAHDGTAGSFTFRAIEMLPQISVPGGLLQRCGITAVRSEGIDIAGAAQEAGGFGIIHRSYCLCCIVIFDAIVSVCPHRVIYDAEGQKIRKKPFTGTAGIVPGIVNQGIAAVRGIRIVRAGIFTPRRRGRRNRNAQIRLGKKLQRAVGLQRAHFILGSHKKLFRRAVHFQQLQLPLVMRQPHEGNARQNHHDTDGQQQLCQSEALFSSVRFSHLVLLPLSCRLCLSWPQHFLSRLLPFSPTAAGSRCESEDPSLPDALPTLLPACLHFPPSPQCRRHPPPASGIRRGPLP